MKAIEENFKNKTKTSKQNNNEKLFTDGMILYIRNPKTYKTC